MHTTIYLDHNATTPISPEVMSYLPKIFSLPFNASAIHALGREARKIMETSRNNILNSLSNEAIKSYELLFCSSGTEANNMVINSFIDYEIFISSIEHDSIIKPLVENKNYSFIPVDKHGLIDIHAFEKLIDNKNNKKIVSIMLANNETGVIQNIEELTKIAHKYGAIFHCDAIQAYGKIPINIEKLGCDLMTISSHKCGGLIGCAALIFKKNIKLKPFFYGGGQEKKLRPGTENIPSIASFGIIAENIEKKIEHYKKIEKLRNKIENSLSEFTNSVYFYSSNATRLPNTSCIKMPNVDNQTQLIKFDMENIAISAGSACSSGKVEASHVLQAMNIPNEDIKSSIRVSLGEYTNEQEIDKFIEVWKKIFTLNKKRTKND